MIKAYIKDCLLIFTISIILPYYTYTQSLIPGLDLIQEGEKKIELPFQYIANFMLVKLEVQGSLPLVFVFDTGAAHTIIFEKKLTDLIGLNYEDPIKLKGSDISADVVAYISRKVSLQINDLTPVKRDILILDDNFLNLTEMTGVRIDGILGASFFKNLILEIDHRTNKLIFWHPDRFDKKLRSYTKMPLEIIDNKPYISCKTIKPNNEEHELKLLVDSGAALSYLININSNKVISPPDNAIPGNLGKGIGGFIRGYKGKMKSLRIGTHEFTNIITHFQELDELVDPDIYNNRDGLIGNLVLERFNIVINYMKQEIYLKPIRNLKKKFRYNMSGMELISFGPDLQNFIIFEIIKNSPAEKAGLKVGDVIKKVGVFSASKYTLYDLETTLSKKPGKSLKIKILREGEILEKKLTLEDYLAS